LLVDGESGFVEPGDHHTLADAMLRCGAAGQPTGQDGGGGQEVSVATGPRWHVLS
jgi:hypothetical protein